MLVAIGSDHAGLDLKKDVIALLKDLGHEYTDYGTDTPQSVDYPDFGEKVAQAVAGGKAEEAYLSAERASECP